MKRLVMIALLASCAHSQKSKNLNNGACAKDSKIWKAEVTERGRKAHVCSCEERGFDKDGSPLVMVETCVDEIEPSPKVEKEFKCTTPCGLRGDFGKKSCAALAVAEKKITAAYARRVPEFSPQSAACAALEGWELRTVGHDKVKDKDCPPDAWYDSFGRCVLGVTHLDEGVVEVFDESWKINALAHELGHVIERELDGTKNAGHCDWEKRGFKAAIKDYTGDDDATPEECAQ